MGHEVELCSRKLAELIAHFAAHAPGFAKRLRAAGLSAEDLRTPADLEALPVLRKAELVEWQAAEPPFAGFVTCPPGELKRIFLSPGPLLEPQAQRADPWRWAPALQAAGFQPEQLVLNAFSYHLTPAGAMFEEGLSALGCTVIPGGVGQKAQQVQLLHTLGATGYVGLPSYLKALYEQADELSLSLRLKTAFVTAEPLPPSLRAYLCDRGLSVRQGYGTAECGNLGYECEQEHGWHIPDGVLVQICDLTTGQELPPGEAGEVVVTLLEPDYALVRFGVGDLSLLCDEPCPCGRRTPRLMGWQGRVDDAVKIRGMFLHPRQLQQLMGRFAEIVRWQVRITRREHKDHLTFRIVVEAGADPALLSEKLCEQARQALRFRPVVAIIEAADLGSDAPAIDDARTWE